MQEEKYRGPLSETQLKELLRFLKKKGELVDSHSEETVYFDTTIFPKIGDFKTGFSRVSLKSTPQTCVLRIKKGNPSDAKRTEVGVVIRKKDRLNLLEILHHLGLKSGFYRPLKRQNFVFFNFKISIKTSCVMGNHFEIEPILGATLHDPNIKILAQKCRLKFWSKVQYQKQIEANMRKNPAIDLLGLKFWK